MRKYLRSDSVEPKFHLPDRPSGLDPYADKLSHMLRQEAVKSRKQKRTVKQLHADLAALGYDAINGFDAVSLHQNGAFAGRKFPLTSPLRSILFGSSVITGAPSLKLSLARSVQMTFGAVVNSKK